MKEEKPVQISDAVAARCDGPDQFAKFDALVSRVLAVPRVKILERAEDYAYNSANNPKRRGPKRQEL